VKFFEMAQSMTNHEDGDQTSSGRMMMPVQQCVTFLNVDLMVLGHIARQTLLRALGNAVVVLHGDEDALQLDGLPCLVLEVADVGLDVAGTLARFVELVRGLPPPARRAWDAASCRRFDIGIQSGKRPHETSWKVPRSLLKAVESISGEMAITVYGAEWRGGARGKGRAGR
jgi:hypothetical protein